MKGFKTLQRTES